MPDVHFSGMPTERRCLGPSKPSRRRGVSTRKYLGGGGDVVVAYVMLKVAGKAQTSASWNAASGQALLMACRDSDELACASKLPCGWPPTRKMSKPSSSNVKPEMFFRR